MHHLYTTISDPDPYKQINSNQLSIHWFGELPCRMRQATAGARIIRRPAKIAAFFVSLKDNFVESSGKEGIFPAANFNTWRLPTYGFPISLESSLQLWIKDLGDQLSFNSYVGDIL